MDKVQGWTETSSGRKTAVGLIRPMVAMDAAQTGQCQCKALWLCISSLGLQIRKQSWARLPKPLWGDKALAAPWVSSELWDATKWPSRCRGGAAHTEHAGIGILICWRKSPGQTSNGAPTPSVPDRSGMLQGKRQQLAAPLPSQETEVRTAVITLCGRTRAWAGGGEDANRPGSQNGVLDEALLYVSSITSKWLSLSTSFSPWETKRSYASSREQKGCSALRTSSDHRGATWGWIQAFLFLYTWELQDIWVQNIIPQLLDLFPSPICMCHMVKWQCFSQLWQQQECSPISWLGFCLCQFKRGGFWFLSYYWEISLSCIIAFWPIRSHLVCLFSLLH